MTSLHELAIQKLVRRHQQDVRVGGLREFLRELIATDETLMGEDDLLTRRPDAWAYQDNALTLFEIEDHNPISVEKMRDYADFWFACDTYDIELKLFVYDRYCEQEREINLCEYLLMFWDYDQKQGKFSA